MKIGEKTETLKIEYNVGNLAPIRILNVSSLLFYLELKKKDPAYALRVEVLDVTNIIAPESTVGLYLGMPQTINLVSSSSLDVLKMNKFVFKHEYNRIPTGRR